MQNIVKVSFTPVWFAILKRRPEELTRGSNWDKSLLGLGYPYKALGG